MSISNGNVSPWLVGGDFNVVLNKEEKIGGVVTASDVEDFHDCIETCELFQVQHKGIPFT